MPIRRKVDKRRDGMPVEKLQLIWGFWARQNFCQLTGLHPPEEIAKARLSEAEEAELGRLHEECEAAGYDPLLAWC